MKVCILSMQRVDNMGSLLQSYALKKTIEKLGNDVEFIDIIKRSEDYELLGNYKQEYHEERELIGLIAKIKRINSYTLNRLKIKKKNFEQGVVFEEFRKNQLNIEKKSCRYDVCVIGSDEVFNCLNAGAWGFTSQLFGNVPEADKVITYAASCGSTRYEELPSGVTNRIRQSFENVTAFSTRDKNTREFVSKLTNKNIMDNLDPVLIYDLKKEIKEVSLPKLPKHYCVIYSYYNRIHNAHEINAINAFCKKHQLTPIAIGAPQFWIKDYIVCTPFQCLKIFADAAFVITDTFHGTIFSVKYANKFAVITRKSNFNKLNDLVNRLRINNHLIKDITQLDSIYSVNKDVSFLNTLLEKERFKTNEYLRKYINGAE